MPAPGPDRLAGLVAEHSTAIANYLRRRLYPLSSADLDDLVEETFVVLWRRLEDVPSGEAERPWVIGVARHVLHNAHRAHRRRQHHESRVRPGLPDASAEDEAIADLAGREALRALGEADRELLRLHFWDGLDVHELAALLGVSANAAGTRLSRAKGRFLEALQAIEARRTDASPADREGCREEVTE